MKKLIFILLFGISAYGQEVSIGIDPGVLDEGIDITFAAKADLYLLQTKFYVGLAFEYFPAIDYFSYHGQFDFPLYLGKSIWIIQDIETRIGVEYGRIVRWNVISYPTNELVVPPSSGGIKLDTDTFAFRTYGANASICFWFGEKANIGWYSELNYKYRSDSVYVWEDAATEWEYSVRTGVKYKFN